MLIFRDLVCRYQALPPRSYRLIYHHIPLRPSSVLWLLGSTLSLPRVADPRDCGDATTQRKTSVCLHTRTPKKKKVTCGGTTVPRFASSAGPTGTYLAAKTLTLTLTLHPLNLSPLRLGNFLKKLHRCGLSKFLGIRTRSYTDVD